jgi:hypothetical protein
MRGVQHGLIGPSGSGDATARAADQAASRLRPLRRRAETMALPARVRIRSRKPCVLCRRRLFGWNVRLLTGGLPVQVKWCGRPKFQRAILAPHRAADRCHPSTLADPANVTAWLCQGQTAAPQGPLCRTCGLLVVLWADVLLACLANASSPKLRLVRRPNMHSLWKTMWRAVGEVPVRRGCSAMHRRDGSRWHHCRRGRRVMSR